MLTVRVDCLPCALSGALRTARAAGADDAAEERIMREVLALLSDWDLELPAPVLGGEIQRRVRTATGCADPYREAKQEANRVMLSLLPELRAAIAADVDPLGRALELAARANRIDFGPGAFDAAGIEACLLGTDAARFRRLDREVLDAALACAESILYLCDNAGEVVADRALIEVLDPGRVTAVVRGAPTINDATRVDAAQVGLDELCDLLDTGADLPGFPPEPPGPLAEAFRSADLVISKGQGNYETLQGAGERCFFLLMAKCVPVARLLRVPVGGLVLAQDRSEPSA